MNDVRSQIHWNGIPLNRRYTSVHGEKYSWRDELPGYYGNVRLSAFSPASPFTYGNILHWLDALRSGINHFPEDSIPSLRFTVICIDAQGHGYLGAGGGLVWEIRSATNMD